VVVVVVVVVVAAAAIVMMMVVIIIIIIIIIIITRNMHVNRCCNSWRQKCDQEKKLRIFQNVKTSQ